MDTEMRNNVKDLEKEKRVDGMQPLREQQGQDQEASAISPGQAKKERQTVKVIDGTERNRSEGGTDCWILSSR